MSAGFTENEMDEGWSTILHFNCVRNFRLLLWLIVVVGFGCSNFTYEIKFNSELGPIKLASSPFQFHQFIKKNRLCKEIAIYLTQKLEKIFYFQDTMWFFFQKWD